MILENRVQSRMFGFLGLLWILTPRSVINVHGKSHQSNTVRTSNDPNTLKIKVLLIQPGKKPQAAEAIAESKGDTKWQWEIPITSS